LGLIFGATYESNAVIPDGTPEPNLSNPVTEYRPTARPGSRAPHVWFVVNGRRVSTTDLLGPFILLLAGEKGAGWSAAAREISTSVRILRAHTVGRAGEVVDEESLWRQAFALESDGAVLIRPDGYVSWRSRSTAISPRIIQCLEPYSGNRINIPLHARLSAQNPRKRRM
jgi:putative polyketide hydroxylase